MIRTKSRYLNSTIVSSISVIEYFVSIIICFIYVNLIFCLNKTPGPDSLGNQGTQIITHLYFSNCIFWLVIIKGLSLPSNENIYFSRQMRRYVLIVKWEGLSATKRKLYSFKFYSHSYPYHSLFSSLNSFRVDSQAVTYIAYRLVSSFFTS